jgi:hypothetical protein
MTRPLPRALLLVVAVLAPPLLAGVAPGLAAGAAAVEADGRPVVIAIDTLSPSVATAGSELRVAGRVANVGRQDLRDVEVRLRVSDARLNSRTELDAAARGRTTSQDGQAVVTEGLADLGAGQTATFSLSRSVRELPQLGEFGVHVLGVEVLASRASGFGRVAIARTLLPWTPEEPGLQPTGFQWLWPLVARPTRLADGSFADDTLAAELQDGGRLDRLVTTGTRLSEGAGLTWVVEPELLAAAEDMADGYRVRGRNGSRVPGGGTAIAAGGLDRLRAATVARPVLALPYGDPDLTALTRAGLTGDVPATLELGRTTVEALLPSASVISGAVWPVDGYVNRATLAALRRADTSTVVLDGRALPPRTDLNFTPSGRGDLASRSGPLAGVLADPGLADLLRNRGGDPLLAAQRLLAETAMITSELPASGTDRTIVLMPPRRWDPDPAYLDRLSDVASQAPWMARVSLRQLAAREAPDVDRAGLRYPAGQRRQELPETYLTALSAMHTNIDVFAAVLSDPEQLVPQMRRAVMLLESSWWRRREERVNRLDRERSYVVDTRNLVKIQPANFTFSSRSGTIPLTIANGLDQEVVLDVRLEPQTPRIRLSDIEPQVIAAQTKVQIEVPATAVAGGPVAVEATLRTPGGALYGQPQQLRITITQYGTVALYITVAAAAVLVVTAAVRVVRRLRGARGGGSPSGGTPSDDTPSDDGATDGDDDTTGQDGAADPAGQPARTPGGTP